ncbi:unnamed protein product [Candida verbasci]|uniref:Protein SYS1 n=1 Tax=Candida verbasci TaxID=1227364 RepID=A0A9W4XNG3_9ASCO|nr:unnamed protein product [Candida verbasci]
MQSYLRLFNTTTSFYYSNDINNPSKLLIQIIILQLFYYLTAIIIFYLVAILNGYQFKLDWIFSWELIDSTNAMGLILFCLWLIDSLLCVLFVTIIVGRSKLAWDFAITVHIINLIISWTYTGSFPTSLLWWCLQIISGTILVLLSTYSTRWKELRTTFFNNMLETNETTTTTTRSNDDIEMVNQQV